MLQFLTISQNKMVMLHKVYYYLDAEEMMAPCLVAGSFDREPFEAPYTEIIPLVLDHHSYRDDNITRCALRIVKKRVRTWNVEESDQVATIDGSFGWMLCGAVAAESDDTFIVYKMDDAGIVFYRSLNLSPLVDCDDKCMVFQRPLNLSHLSALSYLTAPAPFPFDLDEVVEYVIAPMVTPEEEKEAAEMLTKLSTSRVQGAAGKRAKTQGASKGRKRARRGN